MAVAERIPYYTAEEYLALERTAEYKSELINGVIYAMTGATLKHTTITGNVLALLHTQLRGGPCRPLALDIRVKISDTGAYVYPDVVVVCGEVELEDDMHDTLLNPTLIVEVLSPSTEAFDRGAKFGHYRQLPSLQEYMLIAQDRVCVEHFARQQDGWLLTVAEALEDTVQLPAIACKLLVSEVYERVEFEEQHPPSA